MANVSRNTYDPTKNYASVRLQQGVPLVDADWNEVDDIRRNEVYTGLGLALPNGHGWVPKRMKNPVTTHPRPSSAALRTLISLRS